MLDYSVIYLQFLLVEIISNEGQCQAASNVKKTGPDRPVRPVRPGPGMLSGRV